MGGRVCPADLNIRADVAHCQNGVGYPMPLKARPHVEWRPNLFQFSCSGHNIRVLFTTILQMPPFVSGDTTLHDV